MAVYPWTFLQCAHTGELYDWWRGAGERKEALIQREIRKGRSEEDDGERGRQPHAQRCWTQWLPEGGTGWHRPSFVVTWGNLRATTVCERSETHSFIAGAKQLMPWENHGHKDRRDSESRLHYPGASRPLVLILTVILCFLFSWPPHHCCPWTLEYYFESNESDQESNSLHVIYFFHLFFIFSFLLIISSSL